jgi:hypothetical protein
MQFERDCFFMQARIPLYRHVYHEPAEMPCEISLQWRRSTVRERSFTIRSCESNGRVDHSAEQITVDPLGRLSTRRGHRMSPAAFRLCTYFTTFIESNTFCQSVMHALADPLRVNVSYDHRGASFGSVYSSEICFRRKGDSTSNKGLGLSRIAPFRGRRLSGLGGKFWRSMALYVQRGDDGSAFIGTIITSASE